MVEHKQTELNTSTEKQDWADKTFMKLNIKGDEMWLYGSKVKMKQLFL
jgi:hypothetical protein